MSARGIISARGRVRWAWPRPSALSSVRVRLTLWYVVVLALVLVLAGAAVYAVERQSLVSALDARLRAQVQSLAATYDPRDGRLTAGPEAAVLAGDEIVLVLTPRGRIVQRQAAGPFLAKEPWSAVLRDLRAAAHDGDIVEQGLTVALPTGTGKDGRPQVAMQAGLYRFAGVPLRAAGRVVGLLVVGLASDVPRQLAALARALEIVVPLFLLLCAAGGYWLADRALRPVQTITRTARRIGASDLSRRLDLRRHDELGELAATIDDMLDRLEAAFARQRQFAADASHELRTPLAIVDLEATRALARPRDLESYRRALAAIQQENSYMTRLVDDLLTLARADSGQAPWQHEEVDLGEVVLDVVERLAPLAHRNGLAIAVGALPELPVRGDRIHLTRMIANLVENALTYAGGVGTRVCIDAGCRRESGAAWAWLRIADDGPGIAAEHLPHLFERFYRVDRARTHSRGPEREQHLGARPAGSGLGLAIARWIAQAHGGEIRVQSEPGRGAAFDICLPAGDGEEGTWPRSAAMHD